MKRRWGRNKRIEKVKVVRGGKIWRGKEEVLDMEQKNMKNEKEEKEEVEIIRK